MPRPAPVTSTTLPRKSSSPPTSGTSSTATLPATQNRSSNYPCEYSPAGLLNHLRRRRHPTPPEGAIHHYPTPAPWPKNRSILEAFMRDYTHDFLELVRLAATDLPPDVEASLVEARDREAAGSAGRGAQGQSLPDAR